MSLFSYLKYSIAITTLSIAGIAMGKTAPLFKLSIEVPKHQVAEYHAPYIATWIEDGSQRAVVATSLWYDGQEKWLKDIRRWWRKTGRQQKKPYDGVTGATRKPGQYQLVLNSEDIDQLSEPGQYYLMIEATREVGGRETLKLPFSWPVEKKLTVEAKGKSELGQIILTIE